MVVWWDFGVEASTVQGCLAVKLSLSIVDCSLCIDLSVTYTAYILMPVHSCRGVVVGISS